jgi:glutamyl-tRNA synthetase
LPDTTNRGLPVTDTRPVRVRFAPSPTGDLHIGGVRTAQFNWMFARRHGGSFILRIEDTDQKRSKGDSLDGIYAGLRWAGLSWDEGPDVGGAYGPYVQSERLALYRQWADWLVAEGKAYRAYETPDELELISKARQANGQPPGYDRRARQLTAEDWARLDAEGKPHVVRLRVPLAGDTVFEDLVRGPIRVANDQVQDAVLLKADGWPTYHLANIVDDHFMAISHVIRAEEWIPSTPLHVLLYAAFGWQPPQFGHVPVILHPQGGKISKRKHPEAAISYFMRGGYLPEAVTNFLCNVGWNYGKTDEKGEEIQVFTKEEAAEIFDLARVTPSGTKFDVVKLQWLNGEYIRRMDDAELARRLEPVLRDAGLSVDADVLRRVTPLVRERMKLLTDAVSMAGFIFRGEIALPTPELLIPKGLDAERTRAALQQAHQALADLPEFTAAAQEAALRDVALQLGLKPGQFFGPIRAAVSGQQVSPPLFETNEIIGREAVLARLTAAVAILAAPQTA